MRRTVSPKITPADTSNQPYPFVFRLSRWNYAVAAVTLAISVIFIAISFYRDGIAAILLFSIGVIFVTLSIFYILLIKNAFVELDGEKMRYRDIRKIIEFDLNQIYVEIMNGVLILYSPHHRRMSISSYYKNASLLHSLLYKHSEQNTRRADDKNYTAEAGFSSFTGQIASKNRKSQQINNVFIPLLFIGANIYSYAQYPERSLMYHFLFFLISGAAYGTYWYTGRRRAARAGKR